MDDVKKTTAGSLMISEDVIIAVARLAALDTDGVAGLAGKVNKLSKLRKNGSITVRMIEDVAALDIKIKVKSGVHVFAVAQAVQNAVKDNVQSMTGVAVARVNVTVSGVVFDKQLGESDGS
ncbi:MAG: Asp23/Gls24 family envelope stress response protein [Ruminococcus sp.]|nr:Asp23/Gls24 family envelope stress response protein [Ruminococcus sp.]MDE7226110.1 Asp23/Gls24 family envelope stress response protein [Ruminococcus sp.]